MEKLLKYTYLMDLKKIDLQLKRMWRRYQSIMDEPNWDDINEARAILYLLGQIYCEKIAVEAIERRLHLLKSPISLLDFFSSIDSESEELEKLRRDDLFVTLENFYRIIKKFKNNFVGGKYYLDEEKFIKIYNKYNPQKKMKIGYRGKFRK